MTNAQGDVANAILKSAILNNFDALAEILQGLRINNAGYSNSDENDTEGDDASNPKVSTHTIDRKKINFTYTSNRNLQQELLVN